MTSVAVAYASTVTNASVATLVARAVMTAINAPLSMPVRVAGSDVAQS